MERSEKEQPETEEEVRGKNNEKNYKREEVCAGCEEKYREIEEGIKTR